MTDKFNPRDVAQLDALMVRVSDPKCIGDDFITVHVRVVPALIEEIMRLRAYQPRDAVKVNKCGVGDWVEHTELGCPEEINGKTMEIKYRDGKTVIQTARNGPDWYSDCGNTDYDIVAYRHTTTNSAAGGEQ